MVFDCFFADLKALYDDMKSDDQYTTIEEFEESFVFLSLRQVHNKVRYYLQRETEYKQIVYNHDVLSIINQWEQQCGFRVPPTYMDLALVPILNELFVRLENVYNISCLKRDTNNNNLITDTSFAYDVKYPLFSWSDIYRRSFVDL